MPAEKTIERRRSEDALGFDEYDFGSGGIERRVLAVGHGPPVVLMHELPGMTTECMTLAQHIAAARMAAHMPLLVGEPGARQSLANALRLCVAREFSLFAAHGPSAITDWLRALCRHLDEGAGVGVVGMCLTGGFVLAMVAEPAVRAGVTCQPSLPLAAVTQARKRSIGVPSAVLDEAAARGTPVLGIRFSEDRLCPAVRFDELQDRLGTDFRRIEIDSGPRNPYNIRAKAHSTLTDDFDGRPGHPTYEALQQAIAFLRSRLGG